MVKATEVVDLFLDACPSARTDWEEHLEFWEGETAGHYNDIAVFAHHLVGSYERGRTESFERVFELTERLVLEGDDETRGVIIVGFLEDLQNIASHRNFGYAVFEPFLLPQALSAWRDLVNAWDGKTSLLDVIRAEREGA